jgi:hypothetical protein
MKTKDQLLLEAAYSKIFLKESNSILKNGTNVEMIQHPMHADHSGTNHPKYGNMKSTGNYPGKENEGLKGTIIGFDNKNESGIGSKVTYTIKLDNGKTRTYVSPEDFKVI